MATLTGKSRTLRALAFEETDRVPVVGGFIRHPAFLAAAAGVTLEEFWACPREVAIRAFRQLGVDVIIGLIMPDPHSQIGAESDYLDSRRFTNPEEILDELAKLPSRQEMLHSFNFQQEYDGYLRRYADGQAAIGDDILWIPNTFDCVAQFQHESYFGAENYYMALALYPEEMQKFFAHSGEWAYLRNTAVAQAIIEHDLPRVMWLGQDCCDNRGPYLSPETMREMYLPYIKRSLEPLKEIGVTILWHADGNFMPIVSDLLDAGIDGFQGIQETIDTKIDMTALRAMSTSSGKPPIIVGSVSSVTTMPFGTPEDVRADVERNIDLAHTHGGGWLLNFSSSLGPEVPEANIRAFYEAIHKY